MNTRTIEIESTCKAGQKSCPMLAAGEVAKYLGVSVRTIRNMQKDGRLSYVKLGRRVVRFKLDEVMEAIERHSSRIRSRS